MPEQQDQDDDRDRHAEQPKQDAATHGCLLSVAIPDLHRGRAGLVPSATAASLASQAAPSHAWPASLGSFGFAAP
jgi:hypothetical protein